MKYIASFRLIVQYDFDFIIQHTHTWSEQFLFLSKKEKNKLGPVTELFLLSDYNISNEEVAREVINDSHTQLFKNIKPKNDTFYEIMGKVYQTNYYDEGQHYSDFTIKSLKHQIVDSFDATQYIQSNS